MDDLIVVKPFIGLLYMQVCVIKSMSDEDILKKANELNPCGTENGWTTIVRDNDRCLPGPCAEYPDRVHLILSY